MIFFLIKKARIPEKGEQKLIASKKQKQQNNKKESHIITSFH